MTQSLVPYNTQPLTVGEAKTEMVETRKKLRRKTPPKLLKKRPGPIDRRTGKRVMFTYAPWAYSALSMIDAFNGNYSTEVLDEKEVKLSPTQKGGERYELIVKVRVSTPLGSHEAYGGNIYYPDNAEQGKADALQAARSKAFRRAVAMFGPGLDLYFEEDAVTEDASPVEDNKAVWRAACAKIGLTEGNAIAMISEYKTGDQNTLTTLAEICDAISGDVFDAVGTLNDARNGLVVEGEVVS